MTPESLRKLNVTPAEVLNTVAAHYGLTPEDIRRRCRHRSLCRPRQLAALIIREHTTASLEAVGVEFGLHHSTIVDSVRSARRWITPEVEADVETTILPNLRTLAVQRSARAIRRAAIK